MRVNVHVRGVGLAGGQVGGVEMYRHHVVFFRIAGKEHKIGEGEELNDVMSLLTAMHLVETETEIDVVPNPRGCEVIAELEEDLEGRGNWQSFVQPQIDQLLKDLFSGMVSSFPKMAERKECVAVYGVDLMFDKVSERAFLEDDYTRDEVREMATDIMATSTTKLNINSFFFTRFRSSGQNSPKSASILATTHTRWRRIG